MPSSSFSRLENRILLKNRLFDNGFNVRFHSYEYYVIRGKFVSIILLEPNFNRILIRKIRWNPSDSETAIKEIYSVVKDVDPLVEILVEDKET